MAPLEIYHLLMMALGMAVRPKLACTCLQCNKIKVIRQRITNVVRLQISIDREIKIIASGCAHTTSSRMALAAKLEPLVLGQILDQQSCTTVRRNSWPAGSVTALAKSIQLRRSVYVTVNLIVSQLQSGGMAALAAAF